MASLPESQAAVWTDIRQIILTFALVKMVLSRLKRKATWGWYSFLTGNRERDCQGIKARKRRGSGRNEVRSQEKIEKKKEPGDLFIQVKLHKRFHFCPCAG